MADYCIADPAVIAAGGSAPVAVVAATTVATPVAPQPAALVPIDLEISRTFPLGRCEGDCDENADCATGLICFERSNFEAVPGCIGGEDDASRTDYCIPDPSLTNPPTQLPTQPPTTQTPAANKPTMATTSPPTTGVPTIKPTAAASKPTSTPTNQLTLKPTQPPTSTTTPEPTSPKPTWTSQLTTDANGFGTPETPTAKPTEASQQSAEPTTAGPAAISTVRPTNKWTRKPTQSPAAAAIREPPATPAIVPTAKPTTAPTQAPTPTPPVPAPYHNVRLRLYWEEGYTWQESQSEKFWCMMADYRVRFTFSFLFSLPFVSIAIFHTKRVFPSSCFPYRNRENQVQVVAGMGKRLDPVVVTKSTWPTVTLTSVNDSVSCSFDTIVS